MLINDEVHHDFEFAAPAASAAPVSPSDQLRLQIKQMLCGDLGAELVASIFDMMSHLGAKFAGDLRSDLFDNLDTYGENFNVYLSDRVPFYVHSFVPSNIYQCLD